MSIKKLYIFCSGELYRRDNGDLPEEIPEAFVEHIRDSIWLPLEGIRTHIILLSGIFPLGPVASGSVTDSVRNATSQSHLSGNWTKLRALLSSSDPLEAQLGVVATRALGLINWHSTHRYCSQCGSPMADHEKEIARVCSGCKAVVFPRLSPAIIVLVQKEGKILLARHTDRNQDVFSCIAGYVEHGETLEECVEREVFEETGIQVANIRYAGSQSWPYPDQYMIGFYADWKSGEINIDPSELLEANWFSHEHMPNYPMPGTVAWRLIHGFFDLLSKK